MMEPGTTVEVCTDSVEVAVAAERSGADRIELNVALELDGLTPSIGLVREIREAVSIPVIAMARPRAGNFCYSAAEWRVLCRDVEQLLSAGMDGVAFGCLDPEGRHQRERTRQIRQLAGASQLVFHRAFDDCTEEDLLTQLADFGIDRVMTSGGKPAAIDGSERIAELVRRSEGRIGILPASQINAQNAAKLLEETGCDQIHGTFGTRSVTDRAELEARVRQVVLAARPVNPGKVKP